MVQALVVVLEDGAALLLARVVFSGCVDDVAGEDLLPEGKASAGTCKCARPKVQSAIDISSED